MSLTESQLRANRENAQKSTGPTSVRGRRRSSMNGVTHGLTSGSVVAPGESEEAYKAFHQEWLDEYQPQGITERQLVQRLCDSQWRLDRAARYESHIHGMEHLSAMLSAEDQPPNLASTEKCTSALNNLSRHEVRIQRQFDTALKQLRELQASRKHQEQTVQEQAIAAYNFKKMLSEPFVPQEFGFALSEAQIVEAVRLAASATRRNWPQR